jgi:hypothetical protein
MTAASAYTSVHGPCFISGPFAYCSTGAKPGFRITVSAWVMSPITRRAAPKSNRTGWPLSSSRMLSGAMSRW